MRRPHPRVRRFLRWLVRLRGSPEAIARGAAIGVLVAFTPTPGFQMLLALGLATLLGANRPVAVVPTWLTNPFTMVPAYALTYQVGAVVWSGPEAAVVARALREAARQLSAQDFLALRAQLAVFLDLGIDVFVALWIGGLILGLPAAAVTYFVTLQLVRELRVLRARRRARKRDLES